MSITRTLMVNTSRFLRLLCPLPINLVINSGEVETINGEISSSQQDTCQTTEIVFIMFFLVTIEIFVERRH